MWLTKTSKPAFVLAVLLAVSAPARAYFKDPGIGARPLGMGGAYVAAADDGNAVFWNAAGLAQLSRHEITTMFAALHVGLDGRLYNQETDRLGYHFVAYVYPSGWGSFGLGWSAFQSYFYDESIFCLSYGKKLRKDLYAGLNLKRPGWKIEGNEYTRLDKDIPDSGTSRSSFTFDLSLLYNIANRFSAGFSAENLLPADVGLKIEENLPVNVRGGIACKANIPGNKELLAALDFAYRAKDGANVCMGVESWLFGGILGARAGWNLTSATFGFSCRLAGTWLEMQTDYAFVYPLFIQETYGSHRISMSVRF